MLMEYLLKRFISLWGERKGGEKGEFLNLQRNCIMGNHKDNIQKPNQKSTRQSHRETEWGQEGTHVHRDPLSHGSRTRLHWASEGRNRALRPCVQCRCNDASTWDLLLCLSESTIRELDPNRNRWGTNGQPNGMLPATLQCQLRSCWNLICKNKWSRKNVSKKCSKKSKCGQLDGYRG